MVQIYANLIIHGLKTLEDVPKHIRLAVESELNKMKSNI